MKKKQYHDDNDWNFIVVNNYIFKLSIKIYFKEKKS